MPKLPHELDMYAAASRYRLVIAEYEEHPIDDASPYEAPATAKGRQLLFVEHVELD